MNRQILIVDDEFGLGEMLREALAEVGYDVALAANGVRALDLLRQRRFDVVLSDVMMPVMDGPELARAMRADASLSGIPIVLMTSVPTHVPAEAGLYKAVLRKPFTLEVLYAILNSLNHQEH
jgi:CheY-like chemotaxis protein